MKNLKVYKKAIAVLTASSLVLLCGCTSKQGANKAETTTEQKPKYCQHLTVYFEDTPITFKECEGYTINYELRLDGGFISYNISKDGVEVFSHGIASIFNKYVVNHNVVDQIIDEESVKKTK